MEDVVSDTAMARLERRSHKHTVVGIVVVRRWRREAVLTR
jgi:hypothetical protein